VFLGAKEEVIEELLSNGADVHARDGRGQGPLELAKRTSTSELIRIYMDESESSLQLSTTQDLQESSSSHSDTSSDSSSDTSSDSSSEES
jgi:ankyrin repeat protein